MWVICVDARYVAADFYESFNTETEAENRYKELQELYADEISEETVSIYFSKVIKSIN